MRFEMRLDHEVLARVDKFRADQPGVPSRAGAVRRLLNVGLDTYETTGAGISDGEKLILMMLRDLYRHHKISGDVDPEFIQNMLLGGHYWALEWKSPGLIHGHADNENTVHEVVNVLEVWSFIESGYAQLSDKEKARVELEAKPFGQHVRFRGFDGNTESDQCRIAGFLIRDLERFENFGDRNPNSHVPSMGAYRRMLVAFEPMLRTLAGRELSASEIIVLLKEQGNPTSSSG